MLLTLEQELSRISSMRESISDLDANIAKTLAEIKEQYCPFVLGQDYAYVKQHYHWQEAKDVKMQVEIISVVEVGGEVFWKLRGPLYKKNGEIGKVTGYATVKVEATDADA